jgi:hypothetical protein
MHCAACEQEAAWGLLFLYPPAGALVGADDAAPLCAACFYAKQEPAGFVALLHTPKWQWTVESAEDRFGALLKAAQVFWQAAEDKNPHEVEEIFPTLRLAHKVGEQGAGMFSYDGVRLSDVLEEVPILEYSPVRTTLHSSSCLAIQMRPHQRAIVPEEIATSYRRSLEAAGMSWGGKGGRITYGYHGDSLDVEVERGVFSTQGDTSLWPSPLTVGRAVKGMLEEFTEELQFRKGGGEMEAKNLVPAIVTHLLRSTLLNSPFTTITGKTDRQRIHRLLEERVFSVGAFTTRPEPWRQIWRDADKVAKMETLYVAGPMRRIHTF